MYRTFLTANIVLWIFMVSSLQAVDRPNIVLIMADDLGWGDLSCFWDKSPIQTPHLNAMARNGMKFNRFYAAAPVCSPTRGSCLTGRHPNRYGVFFANSGKLESQEICLAEVLKDAGYATGMFGKWHLGTLTKVVQDANRGGPRGAAFFSTPSMHGFDASFCTESKVPTYDPMWKPQKKSSSKGWPFIQNKSTAHAYGTRFWDHQGNVVSQDLDGDDSKVIMDRALPFIVESVEKQQPFLSVVWFHAPHLPVVASPKWSKTYEKHDLYERNYYGCISAMDEQIGRLRETLRKLNIDRETMVWFCSDNGPEGKANSAPGLAGPFRGRKRSLYEGGVRVCGILEWPEKIKTARQTEFPAVTSDYFPTILDALEIEMPQRRPYDGVSLMPLIAGTEKKRDQPIYFHSRKQWAVTTDRYKAYSPNAGKRWELYDLLNDVREQKDLSSQKPNLVDKLAKQFQVWQQSCEASHDGDDYEELP